MKKLLLSTPALGANQHHLYVNKPLYYDHQKSNWHVLAQPDGYLSRYQFCEIVSFSTANVSEEVFTISQFALPVLFR